MPKADRPSQNKLSELTKLRNSGPGSGGNRFVRKDLIGYGPTDTRYRRAVDLVATEEKCWWVNRWLIGNRPLNERPR